MKRWLKSKALLAIDAFFDGVRALGSAGMYLNNNVLKKSFWIDAAEYLLAMILFLRYYGVVINKNVVNPKFFVKSEWLEQRADAYYTFYFARMKARKILGNW